uniref:Holo-[acyl-carrier-protein] synthase n=1 Tax=candidate division WOR-3 bacterium TaxID=2052148 RepID=A0A7V4E2P6_UNCW3
MIYGIGIDIIDVERIKRLVKNKKKASLKKIFSDEEIKYCEQFKEKKFLHYAGKFAAKESFIKAAKKIFPLKDIEIKNVNKIPQIFGKKEVKKFLKDKKAFLSISHIEDYALAFCLLWQKKSQP